MGKKEITQALGDVNSAQAAVLVAQLGAEWKTRFLRDSHSLGLAQSPPAAPLPGTVYRTATPEEAQAIASLAARSMLAADEELRIEGAQDETGSSFEFNPGRPLGPLLKDAVAGRDLVAIKERVEDWLSVHGLELPRDETDARRVLYVWAQALAKAYKGQRLRDEGEPIDTPAVPALPASLTTPVQAGLGPEKKSADALKLRDAFTLWRDYEKSRPAKTVRVAEQALEAFERLTGNPSLGSLSKAHAMAFRGDLLQEPGMSEHTAAKLLGWVQIFLNFEVRWYERLPANPWRGVVIAAESEQVREEWTDAEAVKLFDTPLHQSYVLPTTANAGGDAAYWLPILGAYTGARITELAQLLCADITEEAGTWFINFRITYPSWQSLKRPASRRTIPLHAELIRLGLLDYLKAIKAAGHERLFPDAKWSALNHAGGNVANWFSKYKSALGFGPSNTFHGWRNSVETRLQRKRETQIIIDKYVGHKPGGSEGVKYARLTHLDLLEVPGKIEYVGLQLPVVWPPVGWTAPRQVSPAGSP